MRTWLAGLAALGCLAPAATAVQAQTYPAKPITIVVPAAPGGVTDALGRMLAQRFTEAWGQQAIVENKPGANNQIAAEYVTKAAPDGYTLLIGPETTFVVNPSLYAKLAYDPVKGFTPISGLVTINHALIIHPTLPVAERQGPDRARQAEAGRAQLRHLRGRLERPPEHGAVAVARRREAAGGALQGRHARRSPTSSPATSR